MKNIQVTLTGISPLLVHSTSGMLVVNEGLSTKTNRITGQEEAELGTYRDAEGGLVFPSIAVSRCLWDAGSGIKIGKLTARKALAGFIPTSEFSQLLDSTSGKQLIDFEVDTRFVRIGAARIPRSRAKLPVWVLEVDAQYDPNLLTISAINELLNRAGSLVGIGDYRPSTGGGPFGRFTAEVSNYVPPKTRAPLVIL